MEYVLKEFSSYQDLIDVTETVLRENENGDNKFYLIQTAYGDLGFTYYHLGIKPSMVLKKDILFMGFGTSIIIYNIFNNIIVVCELCVLGFNGKGQLLWENGLQDPIFDYSIGDQIIEIRFEDASVLNLSIDDGRVELAKK